MELLPDVPSGRLLLLGPAGSGKSILALRMARELPVHREPDTPVPVLVPAGYWDPDREGFHDWLVDRIARRYPQLAAGQPRRDAVLRDLVLDEATSALDTETERAVQRAFDVLAQGRTTVTIAHRLSTVRDADQIAVLDHGRIVEAGTHDSLLHRNGRYATLAA